MKHNFYPFLFAILASGLFISCEREEITETLYKGTVIDSLSRAPFPNLEINVSNGENIYTSVHTDTSGVFLLRVRVNEVKYGGYYLLVGDSSCASLSKRELIGLGAKSEIDFGVIEVVGPYKPKVNTLPVNSCKVGTAVSGGHVTDGGRAFVFARGVCWSSTEQYPTKENCENQFTTDGTGEGKYESNITGLKVGATYYIRAYATNRIGTNYGEPVSFKVPEGRPQVTTDSIYEIYANQAKCASTVISDGGLRVLERGVCWSIRPEPTVYDQCEKASADTGRFVCQLRDLELSTPYYVRAYVKNEVDISYGEERQFISADGLPKVTTDSHTTQAASITIGGTVKDNGGYEVLERGICYSTTNMSPTINDFKEICGAGNGSFTITITDLIPAKTYYLRAYAKNDKGEGYGTPISVTTDTGVPTVVMGTIAYTATTASTSVKVTNLGGSDLQSCGVCWSKYPNPSTQGDHVVAGGKQINNEYICNLSNLEPNSTYYICAYATTSITTNYSEVKHFTTKQGKPEVITITPASEIGRNYLVISGFANSISEAPVLRQGICWSANSNPSIADNVVDASVSTNPFSCRIDGLQSGTIYYCRAFAENKYGMVYGESIPFTTEYDPNTLTGYVYDQDGNPISGATVSGYNISGYSGITDSNGFYSIILESRMCGDYEFKADAPNYDGQIKKVTIVPDQANQLDFTLTLTNEFAVDLGTGLYLNPGELWKMYFECTQTHLPGQTTTRNMRIKNYRNVPVSWSITNIPTSGITFSKSSGTIPALSEISITITFIYPSTSSYMVSLPNCNIGFETYVWDWERVYGGYYISNGSAIPSACNACCWQNLIIMVDNYSEAFTLIFNQGLVNLGSVWWN